MYKLFKSFLLPVLLLASGLAFFSCTEQEQTETTSETGIINGYVMDDSGAKLSDVSVSVRGSEITTKTGTDGAFTLTVPATTQTVIFTKDGFASAAMTVMEEHFQKAGEQGVVISPILRFANAKVTGMVTDGFHDDQPFEGVAVTLGSKTVLTDAQGKYTFEKLTLDDYKLTVSKTGLNSVSINITKRMFKNGVVEVEPISLGGVEILPGKNRASLKKQNKWYINEYRAGYGRGGQKLDWSAVFMSAYFDFWGNWEMQNEGCTLRIRNNGREQGNPKDFVTFDTYTCGSKYITEDNKIMSVNVRTHQADAASPAYWACQVVDLSEADPKPHFVGEMRTHGDGSYATYTFDLSDYVGKEVIIAIGIFRAQQGNYFKQLCLGKISFAKEITEGDHYLAGKEVAGLEGWHMTEEHVRSMMPNEHTFFTGLKSAGANIQRHSNPAYHGWFGTTHIAAQWGFMYVNKAAEPDDARGFLIKTRPNAKASYELPESYLYSKFNISQKNDKVTFKLRNVVDDVPSVFRLTAITEDMQVVHLQPVKHHAVSASAVEGTDGCWKFINNRGEESTPEEYASFEYDLSQFNGKNIVLTFAIHKGDTEPDEQRILIHSISFE